MHFHLPKPLHGWREFFGEVAIIVLGVLIALAAEQLVEQWSWRERTRSAIDALKTESGINFRYAAEQVAVEPCVQLQLNGLHDRLIGKGATLPAPVYADSAFDRYVIRHPTRPWQSDVWRSINDDGTSAHFENFEHHILSMNYAQTATLLQLDDATNLTADRLSILAEPIALDAVSRVHDLELIAEQHGRTGLQALIAGQVMGVLRDTGQEPPDALVDEMIQTSGTAKFCHDHHLPTADWRKVLAAVPPTLATD